MKAKRRDRAYLPVEPKYHQSYDASKMNGVVEQWYAGLNEDERAKVDELCMGLTEGLRQKNNKARLGMIGARELLARLYFHIDKCQCRVV